MSVGAARLEVVPTVLLLVVPVLGTALLVMSKLSVVPLLVMPKLVVVSALSVAARVAVTVDVINVVRVTVLVLVVVVVESSLLSSRVRVEVCAVPSLASPKAATPASRNMRIVPSVMNNIVFRVT